MHILGFGGVLCFEMIVLVHDHVRDRDHYHVRSCHTVQKQALLQPLYRQPVDGFMLILVIEFNVIRLYYYF